MVEELSVGMPIAQVVPKQCVEALSILVSTADQVDEDLVARPEIRRRKKLTQVLGRLDQLADRLEIAAELG